MGHLVEHAADHGGVVVLAGRADAVQAERAQRAALLRLHTDRRPHLGDLQLHHATSVISVFFALRSRYAFSIPTVLTSSADLPRIFAITSGRRRLARPLIVARDTLIAIDDTSDI